MDSRTTETVPMLADVRAVAGLLGCSANHVRRLSDAGRMPKPLRVGGLVKWRRSDVLDWIANGCPRAR
ncbi:MAG: helix-turn-helix domain-containing protein [Phycisphaerales bacterium]|nr:helix-turn-helix domain-containing protein [Phycisphaerales bacterium]